LTALTLGCSTKTLGDSSFIILHLQKKKKKKKKLKLIMVLLFQFLYTLIHLNCGGNEYFMVFIDDFSKYNYVYLIKDKSDEFERFKEFFQ
jgi:hypothetical protein